MRRLASLPLALALAIALFASSWAAPGTVNVVSDAGTRLFYVGLVDASDPAAPASGLPSGWNSDPNFDDGAWAPAANSGNFLWLPPSTTPPFAGTGARWISYTASGLCPDYWEASGRRGVYLFRKTFELPSGAGGFSGLAAMAADNYGWLYLNGELLLAPRDPGPSGANSTSPVATATIPPSAPRPGANVLAVEVHNGVLSGQNGAMGVLFLLQLDYQLQKVVWLPPVSRPGFALRNGTSLPLKFQLQNPDDSAITTSQNLYLALYGPSGNEVARWTQGDGTGNLRFDAADYSYVGNLHTKDYSLEEGATYTVKVHDAETGGVLGSADFQVGAPLAESKGKR